MSLLKVSFLQLKRKKIRTFILIISVMLALSLLIGLNAGIDGLQKTYYDLVDNSLGYTDIMIKSNTTTPAFNIQTIEPLLHNDSIAAYSYRVQYWMPFASSDGNFNDSSSGYLVGINPAVDEKFGSYNITEGNYTSLTQALSNNNSCVLSENFAKRLNLHVDDKLTLGCFKLTGYFPPQPSDTMNLTITTIIRDYGRTFTFSSDPTSLTKVNSDITINLETAQTLYYLQPNSVIDVYIHLRDFKQADIVKTDLQNQLGANYTVKDLKFSMLDSVEQNFATYHTITYIIGGMALMITAMLLLNTMLANVSERKREIGILRSVGASKNQVFTLFMAELFPIALIGALASIPASILTTQFITSILPAINIQNVGTASTIEFSFPLSTLINGLVIGIALTLIIGLLPALIACRVKIIEALQPQIRHLQSTKKKHFLIPLTGFFLLIGGLLLVQNGFSASTSWFPTATVLIGYAATLIGAILLATLFLSPLSATFSYLLKPFIGRTCVIVHRNIMLNFRRSVFSYGAFALSIAILVSFSSLVTTAASYNIEVDKQSVGADMQVWVNAPAGFAEQLKKVDGVQNVAGVGYFSYGQTNMTFNSNRQDEITITGVSSKEYFDTIYQIHLTNTLDDMSADQVYKLLSEKSGYVLLQDSLAKSLTVQVGDTLVWSITNQTGTYEQPLQVVATTDFIAGRWETISHFAKGYYTAIVSFEDLKTFRTPLLSSNIDEFYVSLKPGADADQTRNDLAQTCQNAKYNPTIYTAKDTLSQTQTSFNQTEMLVVSVTSFFVLVGALGIMSATAYTVMERKREIGVLTALGMEKKQNRIIIAGESLLLALIGVVIGFVSGLGLSVFVIHAISWWAYLPAPSLVISPLTFFAAALVIVFSAVLSAVYPANRISKLDTIEALK